MKQISFFITGKKLILICLPAILLLCCTKNIEERNSDLSTYDIGLGLQGGKPNILLILADDIGYEVPTCNGGESYSTPNIDQLSSSGMRFTQMQTSPMCSPSRFMLMTGKYNFRNYSQWGILGFDQRTMANMLQDYGYDTYAVGKWQFDGGDIAVKTFGFDEYVLFNLYENIPFHDNDSRTTGRYKNPELYSNGKFLNPNKVLGKYGPDILADSVKVYMEKSVKRNTPFFIYFSMALCHLPFSPTPANPEFDSWDPKKSKSNPGFFASMVNYMDKQVGEVIMKVRELGIARKTFVIFLGDNGTPHEIFSVFNGQVIQGGKMQTYKYGVNVPMFAYCPGKIAPSLNNNLIDLTDFLPTFADVADITCPTSYGILDGRSFYNQLRRVNAPSRDWVFCSYLPNQVNERRPKKDTLKRFIYNTTYKIYDSTYNFYNIENDPYEVNAIAVDDMTSEELKLKKYFISILDTLH